MYNRLIILLISISFFFFTGCLRHIAFTPVEKAARGHMTQAQAHEKALQIEKAEKEYSIVVQKHSDTFYYKEAVLRLVLIKIHPENPKPDYPGAQKLIKKYSGLNLSSREKMIADGYTVLLNQVLSDEDKQKKCTVSIQKQKKAKEKITQELKKYQSKTEELEDKLQKMKAIDVQMHENRKKQK